jgi:hypothetical protein
MSFKAITKAASVKRTLANMVWITAKYVTSPAITRDDGQTS